VCSGVAVAERDLEATPTKVLSRAQSVVSLVEEDQAVSRRDTLLQKSLSSADLQATCVDDTAGDERLITIRDKWLMAARRIVINQSVAKSGNVALDDTDKGNYICLFLATFLKSFYCTKIKVCERAFFVFHFCAGITGSPP